MSVPFNWVTGLFSITHIRRHTLFKALTLWVAIAAIGSVAGWGVSFFGNAILPLSALYGWFSGKILSRFSLHHPYVTVALLFTTGVVARLAVACYLLRQSDTPMPPYGAWQTVIELFSPWPAPAIALFLTAIMAALSIRHSLNKNIRRSEQ